MTPDEARSLVIERRKGRLFSVWYREVYLHSAHWHALRDSKLRVNPRCERCASSDRVQVHHIRYRNVYDVTLTDLESKCRKCHTTGHGHEYIKDPVAPMCAPMIAGRHVGRIAFMKFKPR